MEFSDVFSSIINSGLKVLSFQLTFSLYWGRGTAALHYGFIKVGSIMMEMLKMVIHWQLIATTIMVNWCYLYHT
jgi:hypothetical protein